MPFFRLPAVVRPLAVLLAARFAAALLVAGLLTASLLTAKPGAATFEDLSARATVAREENHLPEAVSLYRQALEINPKWQAGWWFLGTILYDTNQYMGCRDALGHFVELKTDAAPAWGILGLCEFQTGKYAQSLAHLERCLSLGPSDQPEMEKVLRYHEAILLTHAGDFDHAIQKYVWFVRGSAPSSVLLTALGLAALRATLLPKDIPAGQEDLFSTAGTAAFAQMAGDTAGAQRSFRTLLERYPTAHHVHYLYACSLLAATPDQAIQEFRRELELTPASGGTLTMLAWALLNRGDSAVALPLAAKAAKNEPGYPLAQYVVGRSLVETGDVAGGIQHLELAAKLDPANLENHLTLAAAYPKVHRYRDARRERQRSLELTGEAAPVAQR
jgi:tetratricopeptide (TPR) repeat protein